MTGRPDDRQATQGGSPYVTMVLLAAAAYLLGSIPFGYLAGKMKGIDVRKVGSGATGGTNVLRSVGAGAAIFTGLSDLLKGTLAAWLGMRYGGDWGHAICTAVAMVGHSYPVWLGFKGGKGVATGAGGILVAYPLSIGLGLIAGLLAIWPTRWVSLGSLVGATIVAGYMLLHGTLPAQVLASLIWVLVFWRHRENIRRIMAGTENRFGQKVHPRTGTDN